LRRVWPVSLPPQAIALGLPVCRSRRHLLRLVPGPQGRPPEPHRGPALRV